MDLIVLASGKGQRLRNINPNRPKCLLKVKGQKTIFDYLIENFKKFKNVYVVAGYKFNQMKKYEIKNIKIIRNYEYSKTNMVYSLHCAKKYVLNDVIVIYADIFFDNTILNKLINFNGNTIPLKKDWLNVWKQRMSIKSVKNDSENVIFKNNKILEIGGDYKKYPKGQYMGMIKFKKKDFHKMMSFYSKLKNYKIDMTTFLNICIKKKILAFNYFLTKKFWYEIDTPSDFKNLKLKKIKL